MRERLAAIAKLIGRTPMIKLEKIVPSNAASVHVKLEYMNPGGSHKDRIAYYMLRDALDRRILRAGSYVIEASSGNTALSLAHMCAKLGLQTAFVVEEDLSKAKESVLKLLGADVVKVKVDNSEGEDPRLAKARELEERLSGIFMDQYTNEANFRAHYETTAREILKQMNREIDAFVMGIGTGGTIAGVGKCLKEEIGKDVLTVGIVPKGSMILHRKATGRDKIEGLAKNIVPNIYTRYREYIDRVVEVGEKESFSMVERLARKEGLFVGLTTGAAVMVAIDIARELGPRKNAVTVAADSVFRYPHTLRSS